MGSGPFTEGEEKLLLLLMLGQDATISRAQAGEIGARIGRSGDTVRYDAPASHVRPRSLDVISFAYLFVSLAATHFLEVAHYSSFS